MASCILCNSSSYRIISKVKGNDFLMHQLVKCNSCGHIFTDISTSTNLNHLYDDGDYLIRDTQKTWFFKIQDVQYRKVLSKVSSLGYSSNSKLLDFGCGKGVFLYIAAKHQYKNAIGVETSLPRANYAKEAFNLHVETGFYSKGRIAGGNFDIVSIFHVMEHLPNPIELLSQLLKDNLKQGGLLILEVPNYDSWQAKISGIKWLHLDIPRHLSHFTKTQALTYFTNSGMKVLKNETFSLHLGIIGMVQSVLNLFGYKGFLIRDLKENKRNIKIVTLLVLPIAFILEVSASLFGKGGVIRIYVEYKK
jgi:2-polyprenyl-3-methyl-5-hydroxy-6-metoxy-1,4-benzoquinol methylase